MDKEHEIEKYSCDAISDNHALGIIKKYMWRTKHGLDILKNIWFCGSQTIHQMGAEPAVFILANEDETKTRIFGTTTCHSAWACPRCTARVMAKKSTDIACAIDALKTKYHQSAFMVTLTFPHTKFMSCKDAFQILKNTWKAFVRSGNSRGHQKQIKKDGTIRIKGQDPMGKFREELNIKHTIRVYEFTWSPENGWHPHIHLLLFAPDKNFDKILDYEESLIDRWWHCSKKEALKYWNQKNPDKKEENQKRIDEEYPDWKKTPITGHRAFFISKDNNGKVRKESSSHYICGWGADSEFRRADLKSANNGHYTPEQILKACVAEFDKGNIKESDKWAKLYITYALATLKSRRCEFSSRSGIGKIIAAWKQTQAFKELLKKKSTDLAAEKWHVVYWFKPRQWLLLLYYDYTTDDVTLIDLILKYCTTNKQKLYNLLLSLGIPINESPHSHEQAINNHFKSLAA